MPAIYQRLRYETELALMAWHFSHVPASFSQEQNVLNKIYMHRKYCQTSSYSIHNFRLCRRFMLPPLTHLPTGLSFLKCIFYAFIYFIIHLFIGTAFRRSCSVL